ncbi:hypothetical protein SAMN05660703_2280 [Cellulophaga tyrosinoxydans]|uniref:Uncharacterized protein n=2 Tax=Cellulophaga tyrosinoxydans TaxID=504486 RepID=A0A1W2AY66_9FLAO|nr:hypothetical protein SAMN05660703_2280 [Cellulophaga tyrosinoxydans]
MLVIMKNKKLIMKLGKRALLVGIIFSGITSCNFSKSASKDLILGITTKGDGLSAEHVYVTINNEKVSDNAFYYGQDIITNFENMDGFVTENNTYFPMMQVVLVSKKGDTIMYEPDLLKADSGFDASLKTLTGNMILARPIYSGEDYTMYYSITDKKGDGKFSSELKFDVLHDPLIKVEKKGLDFKEGYLMSLSKNNIITNGKIAFDEKILMDFQDLYGYKSTNGNVSLGLKIRVVDAADTVILNMEDAFNGRPISEDEIKAGVGAQLVINKGRLKNPVNFHVTIWDKNSDAKLTAHTAIIVE